MLSNYDYYIVRMRRIEPTTGQEVCVRNGKRDLFVQTGGGGGVCVCVFFFTQSPSVYTGQIKTS